MAASAEVPQRAQRGLTLTVLGCAKFSSDEEPGTMGIAILSGILAALSDLTPDKPTPRALPSRFIACVRRPASSARVKTALGQFNASIDVLEDDNIRGMEAADVILLCCKPQMFREVLAGEKARDALNGKLLISILAGVTGEQIEEHIYGGFQKEGRCRVIRVMPNTAASVRESMTVIANSTPPLEPDQDELVTWIFSQIGRVVRLPPSALDASTAVCGSGPAFMALVLEAIADGGVAMGLPRAEAQLMAAQTMRGTTGMVLNGEHPAILRDKVTTPGGCTIGGLLVLEEGRVRGTVARAVREATVVASHLGKGVQGVNGTRF